MSSHLREPIELIHGGDFTMKPKQMMLFAVAIGCGLVAMLGAQQILSGNKPVEQEMVKILVARMDIDPGVPLDKSNVGFTEWPKEKIPEGAITKEEEFAEHALKIRVSPNMPVLIPYLGPKGVVGVGSMIPAGMNLVTLPVDLTQTHSGLAEGRKLRHDWLHDRTSWPRWKTEHDNQNRFETGEGDRRR